MKFFDLHCDTLYRCVKENKNLFDNNFHVSISKGKDFDLWIESFAVWISDELTNFEAAEFFNIAVEELKKQQKLCNGRLKCVKDMNAVLIKNEREECKGLLALEGSKALNKDLNRVEFMKKCGVKYITLTWNGDCDIGSGCGMKKPTGLTNFGKDVINLMNEFSIIPDLSHASDKLFYDTVNYSKKPIIATHSNSRTICNNNRNLTDDQFKIIRDMGGIVGINFCRDFLREDGNPDFSDIKNHVDYFLSLSGEKTLCIGSDFDGADMPNKISGVESINSLYNYFLSNGYKKSLIDDIFFNNAYEFFKNY